MRAVLRRVRHFLKREDGPTAVEYAVMLALIVALCVASVSRLGKQDRRTYRSVSRALATSS